MKEIILLKSGEIMLKGLNRTFFEDCLLKNTKKALAQLGSFKLYKAQSTFYVEPLDDSFDTDRAILQLTRVFGYSAIARCCVADKHYKSIAKHAIDYLAPILEATNTFRVAAKRSDKSFPLTSPELSRQLGSDLLDAFPHLRVDLHKPEQTITVEVRDFGAYIHTNQLRGAGGIPVGTGGKAAVLLSGGIDSPVAGYMLAKRGLELLAIHFESPPYTSSRALEKVQMLCEKMAEWCGPITFYKVPFTKPQEQMKQLCPEPYITLIMRRLMMQIAEQIALRNDCGALITGESVAQVASQTLKAIQCTDNAVKNLPVFRPVIGMDKEEIVEIARKIDTYETSILPYEDCCTVFTPRRPKTNPQLSEVILAEQALDIPTLIEECLAETTSSIIQ